MRALSRRGGPALAPGDRLNGVGIREAVAGVDTVLHLATVKMNSSPTLGLVLVAAGIWLRLVIVALIAELAFSAPHLAFHFGHLHGASEWEATGPVVSLVASVVIPLLSIALAPSRARRRSKRGHCTVRLRAGGFTSGGGDWFGAEDRIRGVGASGTCRGRSSSGATPSVIARGRNRATTGRSWLRERGHRPATRDQAGHIRPGDASSSPPRPVRADQAAEVARLIELGAQRVGWSYESGADYVVQADVDGNTFVSCRLANRVSRPTRA